MTTRNQLAFALERLDPRDRELLGLSLRRRVPDEALARMYGIGLPELARRRTAAIDRLADALGIGGGEELGGVLDALAADEVWGAAAEAHRVAPERRRPRFALALFGVCLAGLVAAILLVTLGDVGGDGRAAEGGTDSGDGTRRFVPERPGPAAAAPFPAKPRETQPRETELGETEPPESEPREIPCYSTAYVRRPVTLYREPGGPALVRLTARTEWGSPRVFGVVRRREGWLAVQAPELPNGEVGWLRPSDGRLDCASWSLHADLSQRRLLVRRDGRRVRTMSVAVGRPGNSTPKGRFSVTDKLRVTDPGSPYGCCVLALTGHQTNLPAGWPGGDRLAVHATTDLASIGQPASLGCLRGEARQVRWLIETLPLGTPIFIRS